MSVEKLDKRLQEEIRIRKESGLAEQKSLDEISKDEFDVTIELAETIEIKSGLPREEAIEEMEKLAEQVQAGVVDTLCSLGVTDFERLILSNSIAATLSLEQIMEIAKRSDVKKIRLVKEEDVTLDTSESESTE